MEKKIVSLTFLILLLFVSFVLAGDPQTASSPQTSQALNNELAECEANLSLLQQQLQELNQTLENVTRERDYYKTLYENVTVNVTNIELIKIKQNITILNQQIQQLNVSISNINQSIENIEETLFVKVGGLWISIDTLIGITLLGTLIDIGLHLFKISHKRKQNKEQQEGSPKDGIKNNGETS